MVSTASTVVDSQASLSRCVILYSRGLQIYLQKRISGSPLDSLASKCQYFLLCPLILSPLSLLPKHTGLCCASWCELRLLMLLPNDLPPLPSSPAQGFPSLCTSPVLLGMHLRHLSASGTDAPCPFSPGTWGSATTQETSRRETYRTENHGNCSDPEMTPILQWDLR